MPHFIVECSDNIREEADLPGLFAKVNPTLAATGIFPLAGIPKQRFLCYDYSMDAYTVFRRADAPLIRQAVNHERRLDSYETEKIFILYDGPAACLRPAPGGLCGYI